MSTTRRCFAMSRKSSVGKVVSVGGAAGAFVVMEVAIVDLGVWFC